ncbi:hypothetical protein BD414DRAFT_490565 [Trametes punicea]|nr:hypothetical protein BD414DRAFT_490565 [Trametes punicea]
MKGEWGDGGEAKEEHTYLYASAVGGWRLWRKEHRPDGRTFLRFCGSAEPSDALIPSLASSPSSRTLVHYFSTQWLSTLSLAAASSQTSGPLSLTHKPSLPVTCAESRIRMIMWERFAPACLLVASFSDFVFLHLFFLARVAIHVRSASRLASSHDVLLFFDTSISHSHSERPGFKQRLYTIHMSSTAPPPNQTLTSLLAAQSMTDGCRPRAGWRLT